MKKLLLILLCLPMIGFAEKPTTRQVIKEGFLATAQSISYLEYHIAISEHNNASRILVDVLGRESKPTPNIPLFYRYSDGTCGEEVNN